MQYTAAYESPLGQIRLASDGEALTGLWLPGQKFFAAGLTDYEDRALPVFALTGRWLDVYFSGREPDFEPPLSLAGTEFQMRVWAILRTIPYGRTVTYGQIAKQLAPEGRQVSAQAVGGAVGRNPISVIVPCHRVVGANGGLTGYAGGLDKKIALLKLENAWDPRFH